MRIGNPDRRWRRRSAIGASLVSTAALAATSMSVPASAANGDVGDAAAKEMRVESVLAHLDEFQAIADRNGGTRYASSSGYDESAAYVAGELRDTGYDVTIQEFPFVYTEERRESLTEVSPTQRTLPVDVMTYSGSTPVGGITAGLSTVP